MPFWSELYFMDANTPLMEQMLMFHDHSMMIICSIMVFLLIMILHMSKNKFMYFYMVENQMMEMLWTLLPMILLMLIAAPSIRLLYLMEEIFIPSLTIKVIGHQWYWSYEYSDFKINYDSFMKNADITKVFRLIEVDTSMFIPMNASIRVLVTSSDVIHSWTIQSMGVKTDAIPGRLNMLNFFSYRPGIFFGQCSEICGLNHSFMPIKLCVSNMNYFKMNMFKKMYIK